MAANRLGGCEHCVRARILSSHHQIFRTMKQVNKDYISVVRSFNRKLHYERIPIQKSEILSNRLIGMANDERFTLKDMVTYLTDSPIFVFMAQPFHDNNTKIEYEEPANWTMKNLVDAPFKEKTKVKFLEKALELIEECDFRWNVLKMMNSTSDIALRSMAAYESSMKRLTLSEDNWLVTNMDSVGRVYDGEFTFTIIHKGNYVLPYRSLVELFECAEETLESSRTFDAEEAHWDNYLRAVVSTGNEILERGEEYFKEKVISDGLLMAEKITQMCTDLDGYYNWLWFDRGPVKIEYSENEADPEGVEQVDASNQDLMEIFTVGRKLTCAMYMAENLQEWSKLGGEYSCLEAIYPQMMKLGPDVLERMERAHDLLPAEVFEEQYAERGEVEKEKRSIALELRKIIDDLREWLEMETRFREKMSEW